MMLALMPVLSRAHTDAAHFEDQTLQIPVGSGPYIVAEVKPGERLVLKRDPNYWARDLPVIARPLQFRRDPHRLLPRRDRDVRGLQGRACYDFRDRGRPDALARPATTFPPSRDGADRQGGGRQRPAQGHLGLRLQHAPADVRRPAACARRWRRCSTSSGSTPISTPASTGARAASSTTANCPPPAGRRARSSARCSRPFPARCATTSWRDAGRRRSPDGSGRDRALARRALDLLGEAGYTLTDGALRDARGQPLAFEILVKNAAGGAARARLFAESGADRRRRRRCGSIDEVQYQRRRDEVRFRHDDRLLDRLALAGRRAAQRAGARPRPKMEGVLQHLRRRLARGRRDDRRAAGRAKSHEDFVAAVRALDRVLISGFYIVPLFYAPEQWIAYSARLGRPGKTPLFGVATEAWWRRPE